MTTRREFLAGAATVPLLFAPTGSRADEKKAVPKQVLVVNTQDESVSTVDLTTMKEVHSDHVGKRPYGIAVSKDGKTAAVGVEDEECVKFFSLPDFKLKGSTKIGKMVNDHIVLTQDGKHVLVANFYSDDVVGIDVETMKESFRIKDCSAPHVVKYGPLKKHAFVTCKKVTGIAVINPDERKQVKVYPLNVNPRSLTFSPDETKLFFGSFWVDGFFEMDTATGKVTKLHKFDPPKGNAEPQEVTYHGVEMLTGTALVAANEGRSYIDAVDVATGKLLDRLIDVPKPCCVEKVPGTGSRFLISNLGDGTLQLVELTAESKLKSLGKAQVGKAPKRVAFLPTAG
jgi:YVTN family beta-propeller protein